MPNARISLDVIFCAAPLSETSLPSIEPKPSIRTRKPIVLPMPFSIETIVLSSDNPSARPTVRATIIKDKKELNFATRIRKRRRQIPRITITSGMFNLY
jgi:hypothetical protein